uniref:OTU domain-containing protein n=1 Tax=Oryza brachyantha TaxID=4533 RepID=J3L6T7_ORYBR
MPFPSCCPKMCFCWAMLSFLCMHVLYDSLLVNYRGREMPLQVADEFVRRRGDTEWMPITVYMYTKGSDSPRIIAEYGQEYGKDNPICVLYDGYGHYNALQPSLVRTQSRLLLFEEPSPTVKLQERNTDNRRLRYLRLFSRTVSSSSAT